MTIETVLITSITTLLSSEDPKKQRSSNDVIKPIQRKECPGKRDSSKRT